MSTKEASKKIKKSQLNRLLYHTTGRLKEKVIFILFIINVKLIYLTHILLSVHYEILQIYIYVLFYKTTNLQVCMLVLGV